MKNAQVGGLASAVAEPVMAGLVKAIFAFARALGPERSSRLGGFLARNVGPLVPNHRTARANLEAAFPQMPEAERAVILKGAWDNLGRNAAEYANLDRLYDYDPQHPGAGRIEFVGYEHIEALRDDGRPGLMFTGHLGNWELLPIGAVHSGLPLTAVFRPPKNRAVARAVHEIRSRTMGGLEAARQGAALAVRSVLQRGDHLGILIDQHFTRGVVVDFLGRPALANPLIATFARHFECPVHGARVVRLPGGRFRIEVTPPLDLPRDSGGQIEIQGAMQMMTGIVEGWVREHPEQWLWMHRRWRVPVGKTAADQGA